MRDLIRCIYLVELLYRAYAHLSITLERAYDCLWLPIVVAYIPTIAHSVLLYARADG
jgi:hypothetical protein